MEPVLRIASRSIAWTGPITIPGAPVESRHRHMPVNLLPLYRMGYIVASQEGPMLRRAFIAVSLLCWAGAAFGSTVVDATGRSVVVPEQIRRVLPAGPPAAILLA